MINGCRRLGIRGNPNLILIWSISFHSATSTASWWRSTAVSFAIRKGSRENCTEIARLCKKYQVPIVVDSDSHIEYTVGCVDNALEMLEEIGFPEELVVNSSRERLDEYFRGRGLTLFG